MDNTIIRSTLITISLTSLIFSTGSVYSTNNKKNGPEFEDNNPFQNGLLILDKSLDRDYTNIINLCNAEKLDYFLIRLSILKEDALNNIMNRNGPEELPNWEKNMPKWIKDYKDFGKNVKANITLDSVNPDLSKLYKKLDKEIAETINAK